jgi:hypothetical protein
MVNETLLNITNSTLEHAGTLARFSDTFIPALFSRFIEVLTAPFNTPGMLWIVTPLWIIILLMELYFGRYTSEELGWNTAVGNSLVLIFITIDLLRHIYGNGSFLTVDIKELFLVQKTVIAMIIGALSLVLLFTDFFHMIPKKLAFLVSATLPIHLIAYFAIVFVYSNIPLDGYAFISILFISLFAAAFFSLLKMIIPKADNPPEFFKKRYFYNDEGLTEMSYDEKRSVKEEKNYSSDDD